MKFCTVLVILWFTILVFLIFSSSFPFQAPFLFVLATLKGSKTQASCKYLFPMYILAYKVVLVRVLSAEASIANTCSLVAAREAEIDCVEAEEAISEEVESERYLGRC